jgi:histone-lysine N-methyltransferase SETD3
MATIEEVPAVEVVQEKKSKKKKKKNKNKEADPNSTLLCSSCQQMQLRGTYSAKQIKLKGKRRCGECIMFALATSEAEKPFAQAELDLLEAKGTTAVKQANAEAIRRAQESAKNAEPAPTDEADRYDVMLNWLRQGNSQFGALSLKYYTVDYRGVHANRRLAPGECILEVPLRMIMTTDKAKECKIGRAIAASNGTVHSSHTWLAAMLLQEKTDPQSFWKPYIDCLPKHYRNMPIFFDQSELNELEGSFTLEMISNRKVSLGMEYKAIADHCPEFARFHKLEFMWARLAVITRIFGFEVAGRKCDGLVAMADMLNHKNPHETAWNFDDAKGCFTITTTKRLLKGSQIFDSYGRKCNSRYFVNYGFSLTENEDNQVAMFFGLLPAEMDPLRSIKARILGERDRRFQIPFDHCEEITTKCMSYLRVVHADQEDLEKLRKQGSDFKNVPPISMRNEASVLQHVAIAAQRVLSGFPTTLEQDNKILQDPEHKLTMNIRNCVLMRRGEKEVCHAYIDLAPRAQAWAQMSYTEFKRDFARNIKNRGREPSFEWRLEMYASQVWKCFYTGETVDFEVTSNAHTGD